MKNVLVITDNIALFTEVKKMVDAGNFQPNNFVFRCSKKNTNIEAFKNAGLDQIDVVENAGDIVKDFDIVISLHCNQIFPPQLVDAIKCVNIHPGFNPYNRGWFPNAFCLMNGLPAGATIHEIDNNIDNGPVIVQKEVEVEEADNAKTLYSKIQNAEISLIKDHLDMIIGGKYDSIIPPGGNLNFKKDFEKACLIDLDEQVTARQLINRLRALTYPPYTNAYFINGQGSKVYVGISLQPENPVIF